MHFQIIAIQYNIVATVLSRKQEGIDPFAAESIWWRIFRERTE
jgi:hypothetical protein